MDGEQTTSLTLPGGTVTFLLTDIEGSTRLWDKYGERMAAAVRAHYALLAEAIARHGGVRPVEQGEGDSVVAAFPRATDAVAAAVEAQRALLANGGPAGLPVRVRIALHTAEAQLRDNGSYFGAALNRCARIRSLAAGGQTLLSRTTRDLVRDRLPRDATLRDLGLHRLRDLDTPEHVFALAHPDLPVPPVALPSVDAPRHNLPIELTSFIGRETELADINDAMMRTRLITLTGAGGCGKTRLAAQVAADALDAFPEGVWWIEFAPLADGSLVDRAVADAVGARPMLDQTPLEAVLVRLADARSLLILDNCEHVLEDAARFADVLLRGCPRVSILATSRAALGTRGEKRWRVPSMTVPSVGAGDETTDTIGTSDAARLFVERARMVDRGFEVTGANAASVAQICRDLDGIPLALELAAARVGVLAVDAIAARLGDRFRLLTRGGRGVLRRQQTLRASVDWSYDLLDEREQALLRRLAVFRGGWTLAAAEVVCEGDPIERREILDVLSSLVEKSLVDVDHGVPGGRYGLLETVRQYAQERLREAKEEDVVADRHRDAMAEVADRAALELATPRGRDWLDALDVEAPNLMAALDNATRSKRELALAMCSALYLWWKARGHFRTADEACAAALHGADHTPSALRAGVLAMRGSLAIYGGDTVTAERCAREALAMAERIDDTLSMARALDALATLRLMWDPPAAQELARRGQAFAVEAGDDWCRCSSALTLALSHAIGGQRAEAVEVLEAVWPLVERVGSAEFEARYWLAHALAAEMTDIMRWRQCAELALRSADQIRERTSGDFAAANLAAVQVRQGRAREGIELLEQRRQQAMVGNPPASLATLDVSLAKARLGTGELAEAQSSLTAFVSSGRPGGILLATAHGHLAEIALVHNDAPPAVLHADKLTTISHRVGNPNFRAWAAYISGRAATAARRRDDAKTLLLSAITLQTEYGLQLMLPDSLEALAEAIELDDPTEATRLLAAAESARERLGIVRVPTDHERWSALNQRLRRALGDAEHDATTGEGRILALGDVATRALRSASQTTQGAEAARLT